MPQIVFLQLNESKVADLKKQFKSQEKKFKPASPEKPTHNSEICRALNLILNEWEKNKTQIFFDPENKCTQAAVFLKQEVSEKILQLFLGYEASLRNSEARYALFLNTLLSHIVNHLESSTAQPISIPAAQPKNNDWDFEITAESWSLA